jgi:hypothetical protein
MDREEDAGAAAMIADGECTFSTQHGRRVADGICGGVLRCGFPEKFSEKPSTLAIEPGFRGR